jgi:hypothetical protein
MVFPLTFKTINLQTTNVGPEIFLLAGAAIGANILLWPVNLILLPIMEFVQKAEDNQKRQTEEDEYNRRLMASYPPGYEAACSALYSPNSGNSREQGYQNLMEQLRAGNLPDQNNPEQWKTIHNLLHFYGQYRDGLYSFDSLDSLLQDVERLLADEASPEINFIGSSMLLYYLYRMIDFHDRYETLSRPRQAYALERIINGYERFLSSRPEIKPSWGMACIYYACATAAEDKEQADIYLQKAAAIYYDILLHTGIAGDFHKAICYYFLTQHDWQKIEPALQTLDRTFREGRKLLSEHDWREEHPQDKENSLWTIKELYQILREKPTMSSYGELSINDVKNIWDFIDDRQIRLQASYYLWSIFSYSARERDYDWMRSACAELPDSSQWLEIFVKFLAHNWNGYQDHRLYLEAEIAYLHGDIDKASDLLTEFLSSDRGEDRAYLFRGAGHASFERLAKDISFESFREKSQIACPPGYQEAWAAYLNRESRIDGETFKAGYANLLSRLKAEAFPSDLKQLRVLFNMARFYGAKQDFSTLLKDVRPLLSAKAGERCNLAALHMLRPRIISASSYYDLHNQPENDEDSSLRPAALKALLAAYEPRIKGYPLTVASLYAVSGLEAPGRNQAYLKRAADIYQQTCLEAQSHEELFNCLFRLLQVERDGKLLLQRLQKIEAGLRERGGNSLRPASRGVGRGLVERGDDIWPWQLPSSNADIWDPPPLNPWYQWWRRNQTLQRALDVNNFPSLIINSSFDEQTQEQARLYLTDILRQAGFTE